MTDTSPKVTASSERRVIGVGVDPGIKHCGLVLIERTGTSWNYVDGKTVTTHSSLALTARMRAIREAFFRLIVRYRTSIRWIGIEDPWHVIPYKQERGTTDLHALRLLTVVGQAIEWAFSLGAEAVPIEPHEAKRGVGAGHLADKGEMIRAAKSMVYSCPSDIDSHRADAVAVAIVAGRIALTDPRIRKAVAAR